MLDNNFKSKLRRKRLKTTGNLKSTSVRMIAMIDKVNDLFNFLKKT